MKLKILAFAFILAFTITSFAALGVSGASAGPTLITPEQCVDGPDAATGGAITGFAAVTTMGPGDIDMLDVSFTQSCADLGL